jgi:putative DNA primase/helicase
MVETRPIQSPNATGTTSPDTSNVVVGDETLNDTPYKLSPEDNATLDSLARLTPLEYDRARSGAARTLKVGALTLDAELKRRRATLATQAEQNAMFAPVVPWTDPVKGDELLDAIAAEFTKYVVLPPGALEALSVWAVFTWTVAAFDVAPILAISSPEKRCGKSTVLILLQELVNRPLPVANTSPSALFRSVETFRPTLLLDEADAWMRDNQELRGIINAGHTRKMAKVMRSVGDDHIPKTFDTFCPKAIAGIGRNADTISDRAVIVPMRRKMVHEVVERLRQDRIDLSTLRSKCARWAADNLDALRLADPVIPRELNDRAQDNWRPLITIADAAGGSWPERVRAAALQLIDREQEESAHGMTLLRDLHQLYLGSEKRRIRSEALCFDLNQLEERPWNEWNHGRGIKPNNVSRLLKPFGIHSKQMRDKITGKNVRGYVWADCFDAFRRYLEVDESTLQRYTSETSSVSPISAATRPTPAALGSAT